MANFGTAPTGGCRRKSFLCVFTAKTHSGLKFNILEDAKHLFDGCVSFHNMNNSQALEAVLNRVGDIGIVHTAKDSAELVLKHLFTSRLRIVVPIKLLKSRPSAKAELIEKLKTLPCHLYKIDDTIVENFLKEFGLNIEELNISRIYSNYASLIQMMKAEWGWSIIPSNLLLDEKHYHIFQLSGRTPDERQFSLCYRKELKDAVWFKELLKELTAIEV